MNRYLEKYSFREPQITERPASDVGIIVVIPVYNEEAFIQSLESLANCDIPECKVEVISVINSSETEGTEILERNLRTLEEAREWSGLQSKEFIQFHFIHEPALPKKHAGVGLARKIGMDEAVSRFEMIDQDGIIVCYDADSMCDANYLVEIERHFLLHPKTPGCSVHFEHPVSGTEFSEEVYQGIVNYELHLRYYKEAMEYCRLPYAYHTVGSSMAVRSSAYQKQGGMNKRKAGEDFYFLHKIIALGGFTNLTTTRVIPSPRSSDRVPFGTGRAIGVWLEESKEEMETYSFKSFQEIRRFIEQLPDIYRDEMLGLPPALVPFLEDNNFKEAVRNAQQNSTSYESFRKRFFVWFDAFKLLKCVHFLRDTAYVDRPITEQCRELLKTIDPTTDSPQKASDLLQLFREKEKG